MSADMLDKGGEQVKGNNLLIRVSVDKDSMLGKLASIEQEAEQLRFDAMHLREAISCGLDDEEKEKPEA